MAAKPTGVQKTSEPLKAKADKDTFVKDYLVRVDDSSKVSDEIIDRNKKDVEAVALQRGLRTTSDVELTEQKAQDAHNVLLVYSVEVEPNTK